MEEVKKNKKIGCIAFMDESKRNYGYFVAAENL
jgi:hypothetical protein